MLPHVQVEWQQLFPSGFSQDHPSCKTWSKNSKSSKHWPGNFVVAMLSLFMECYRAVDWTGEVIAILCGLKNWARYSIELGLSLDNPAPPTLSRVARLGAGAPQAPSPSPKCAFKIETFSINLPCSQLGRESRYKSLFHQELGKMHRCMWVGSQCPFLSFFVQDFPSGKIWNSCSIHSKRWPG